MNKLEDIIADFEKRIAALEGQVQAQPSVEEIIKEIATRFSRSTGGTF